MNQANNSSASSFLSLATQKKLYERGEPTLYIEFGPMHNGTCYHNTMPVLNIAPQTPAQLVIAINAAMAKSKFGIEATVGHRYGFYAYDEKKNFMYCLANLEDHNMDVTMRKLAEYVRPFTHANKYNRLYGIAVPLVDSEYRPLKEQFIAHPDKFMKHAQPFSIFENVLQGRYITPEVAYPIDFAYYMVPKSTRNYVHARPFFIMGVNLKSETPIKLLDDTLITVDPMILVVNPELISFIRPGDVSAYELRK